MTLIFSAKLLATDEIEPLFVEDSHTVITNTDKSGRIWKGLEKKTMPITRNMLWYVWLS